MIILLIRAAVLQVVLVSAASTGVGSRLWAGRSAEGSTSAVLSATGSGYVLNNTIAQAAPVECAEACDRYTQGVSKDSESVCIDALRTCSLNGCGMGLCVQRFHDECTDHCSEWGDATSKSINVCLHKEKKLVGEKPENQPRPYRCSGEQECPANSFRCQQKEIPECFVFCDGYGFSGDDKVDQDTDLVCQNTESKSPQFGVCMNLPCSMQHHNSINYKNAGICRQIYPNCPNTCADGSEDHKDKASVCFDNNNWAGSASPTFQQCTNHAKCPGDTIRCRPIKHHQDYSKVDKEKSSWSSLVDESNKMTWTESRAEQHRARVAALRRAEGRSLIRRDTVDESE